MNFLEYKNRFTRSSLVPTDLSETNGYLMALQDLLEYLMEKTEFRPEKRMIDSVGLLDCITETNAALMKVYVAEEEDQLKAFKELSGHNYDSNKVKSFLKDQTDDIPAELFTQKETSDDQHGPL